MGTEGTEVLDEKIYKTIGRTFETVFNEIGKGIIGQKNTIEHLIIALLCDGHALLEGYPGLGKTLMISTLAKIMDLKFSRIQCTPDIMPSDITGTYVIEEQSGKKVFRFERGPVFANIVLADEINRATPKAQSALLEAMQEKQVTAGNETYQLDRPFFVLATQNPIEMEGSLALEQPVFVNGSIANGSQLLIKAKKALQVKNGEMVLYHIPELWTFTLNQNGLLEKQDCMLYTLPYHDEIVYVTTRTGRTITVTKNHPFLVNRFGQIIWKKAEELTLNDYLVCPAKLPEGDEKFELMDHEEALNRLSEKFRVVKLEDIKELRDKTKNFTNFESLTGIDFDNLRIALGFSKIELLKKLGLVRSEYWKLIKFLRDGKNERIHRLLTNYFKENHPKCEYDFIESYKITRMKRFNVDEDFIFWIAFLLSDGSISENYVAAYQKNYPKALDRFIELTVNKLGINISEVISEPDGRTVIIRSKPLVEYLKLRFDTAPGKGIPPWMLSLPANLRREFLRTFISLESSNRDNRITFSQVNKDSVNVIIHMLTKEGILTWIKDQKRIFRLKIQGQDYYAFLKKISWIEQFKIDLSKQPSRYSNFRAVPIPRQLVLELVKLLGLTNFRSCGTKKFFSRTWHGSYKSIKEGRERISEYFYKVMLEDLRKEIDFRRTLDVETLAQTDPHRLAILCGLSITEISREANFSKHTVWQLYTNGTSHIELKNFIKEKFKQRLNKAERILAYLQGLLTEDIYYDKVHKIEYKPYSGLVFGLVVPGLQNYLAGFGACGINHNTYPLPEAQLDRFLLKVLVDYPTEEEEDKIVEMYASHSVPAIQKIIDKETLLSLQRLTRQMPIAEDIKKHALDIVTLTRSKDFATKIEYGASPRASIGLVLTSKARALIRGKNFVSKEDINAMAYPILRHRIILTFDAERKGITQDAVINEIIQKL